MGGGEGRVSSWQLWRICLIMLELLKQVSFNLCSVLI